MAVAELQEFFLDSSVQAADDNAAVPAKALLLEFRPGLLPGMEDPELISENVFSTDSVIRKLTEMSPYNTTCTLEDGRVVRIDAGSYPVGPVDPFVPVDR